MKRPHKRLAPTDNLPKKTPHSETDWAMWLVDLRSRSDPPDVSDRRRVRIAQSFGNRSTAAICRFTGLSRRRVQAIVTGVKVVVDPVEQQKADRYQRVKDAFDGGRTTGLAISMATGLSEDQVAPHLSAIRKNRKAEVSAT